MAQYRLNWGEAPGCIRGNPGMEQATLEEVATGTPARDHVVLHPPLPSPPATAPRSGPFSTPLAPPASTRPPSAQATSPSHRPPAPPSGPGTATQGMSPAAFEAWAVSVEDYGLICGWFPPLAAPYVRLLCDGSLQQRIDARFDKQDFRQLSTSAAVEVVRNTDSTARAILQYLNTPLHGLDASPAQLLTGRQLRDAIPVESSRYLINEQWGRTLRDRERAMIQTSVNSSIRHDQQAHSLTPLRPGQRARIQNPSSGRWDRVGTVLELSAPRQYLLRLDGSGRASIRNRRHLRPLTGEPQLSDDSTESPTPVRVTTPRPRRTQRAPRHLDDYFLNSPVRTLPSCQQLSKTATSAKMPDDGLGGDMSLLAFTYLQCFPRAVVVNCLRAAASSGSAALTAGRVASIYETTKLLEWRLRLAGGDCRTSLRVFACAGRLPLRCAVKFATTETVCVKEALSCESQFPTYTS
ncbi:hypothetical protein O3P69_012261 [Scylla paramamosain]|uniref:Uncharacterized protein n=1 Tax=Scylla paramamosain TaxID=85552 RepID=A0AAW0TER4_SCYPA